MHRCLFLENFCSGYHRLGRWLSQKSLSIGVKDLLGPDFRTGRYHSAIYFRPPARHQDYKVQRHNGSAHLSSLQPCSGRRFFCPERFRKVICQDFDSQIVHTLRYNSQFVP